MKNESNPQVNKSAILAKVSRELDVLLDVGGGDRWLGMTQGFEEIVLPRGKRRASVITQRLPLRYGPQ